MSFKPIVIVPSPPGPYVLRPNRQESSGVVSQAKLEARVNLNSGSHLTSSQNRTHLVTDELTSCFPENHSLIATQSNLSAYISTHTPDPVYALEGPHSCCTQTFTSSIHFWPLSFLTPSDHSFELSKLYVCLIRLVSLLMTAVDSLLIRICLPTDDGAWAYLFVNVLFFLYKSLPPRVSQITQTVLLFISSVRSLESGPSFNKLTQRYEHCLKQL